MTKVSNPSISVIMPAYNAERFIAESIDSILRQTFTDFELIIIDDGSTDFTRMIIESYTKKDDRIRFYSQTNHGVVYTANKAIKEARGRYIARIDADDIAMPDRLRQQFNILEDNPDTVLVCSSFEVISDEGEFLYKDIVPPDDAAIKLSLYIRNPIANGSTLIRTDTMKEVGLFDDVFAEDLHMWTKLASKGLFQSTGTIQYRWRMNPSGLTLTHNDLSQQKGAEYIEQLWTNCPPVVISRQEIKQHSRQYITRYGNQGKIFRNIYLTDLSRLSSKFILRHQFLAGIKQLINVALSGQPGFLIALQRIYFIIRGRIPAYRKKV